MVRTRYLLDELLIGVWICDILYWLFSLVKVYLLIIISHFTCVHLYTFFCTPKTLVGFLMSPFMTQAPHCVGLQWIISYTHKAIQSMWITFGTGCIGLLTNLSK